MLEYFRRDMPILEIKKYPDPILKKKASEVKKIGEKESKLAYSMVETMRSANGAGLAAPQVGVSKRIIVIEDVENHELALILINPKIIKKKGRSSFCEGCLSVPEISSDIVRPESIVVEAFNLDGETLRIKTGGILARIIQHEVDHLDGILFIERVNFLKRKKIIKHISSKICMEL